MLSVVGIVCWLVKLSRTAEPVLKMVILGLLALGVSVEMFCVTALLSWQTKIPTAYLGCIMAAMLPALIGLGCCWVVVNRRHI